MRVRPFFWALLLASCLGVLILALLYNPHIPTILQVHIDNRNLVSHGMSNVDLQLTDPDGLPITQARVKPNAYMTNMNMVTDQSYVTEAGNGHYLVQLHLYMAITIQTQADGFLSQQKTLFVEVT